MRHFLKIPNEEKQVNSVNGDIKNRFWMVWRFGSSVMAKQHESQGAAQREAERLAAENPGKKFYVLQAQSVSTIASVVTTNL